MTIQHCCKSCLSAATITFALRELRSIIGFQQIRIQLIGRGSNLPSQLKLQCGRNNQQKIKRSATALSIIRRKKESKQTHLLGDAQHGVLFQQIPIKSTQRPLAQLEMALSIGSAKARFKSTK